MTWNDNCAGSPSPRLSEEDGYVRLSLDDIFCVRMVHLLSGLDDHAPPSKSPQCGSQTVISGYSEWVSSISPRVSLGWDWRLSFDNGLMGLVRVGLPRSNVMLIDRNGIDYGWLQNLEVLGTVVDALPWRNDPKATLARCTL